MLLGGVRRDSVVEEGKVGREPVTSGFVLGFLTSPSFLRLVFGG